MTDHEKNNTWKTQDYENGSGDRTTGIRKTWKMTDLIDCKQRRVFMRESS